MAERDFDSEYKLDEQRQVGHTFMLNGYEFHTLGVAPVAAFRTKGRGVEAAIEFLNLVLIPEDAEVFQKMVDDPNANMSAYQLDQIASWLLEVTSGKPFGAPA